MLTTNVLVKSPHLPGPVGAVGAAVRPLPSVHHVVVSEVIAVIELLAAGGAPVTHGRR